MTHAERFSHLPAWDQAQANAILLPVGNQQKMRDGDVSKAVVETGNTAVPIVGENDVYAIRQKSTGLYIPETERGRRWGGSYQEPSSDRPPRLFQNKKNAVNFLSQWLLGHHKKHIKYFGEDVKESHEIIFQPHRKKDDMEVVRLKLVEEEVGNG